MPNIKSAKKRVKVNATKAAANKARKSNLKTVAHMVLCTRIRLQERSLSSLRSSMLLSNKAFV